VERPMLGRSGYMRRYRGSGSMASMAASISR
jgi:hypothetical protein